MSRFYVSKDQVEGNSILITGKEAHHILNVMRLKRLDKVAAFDGTGKEYTGFISQIGSRTITVEIVETRVPPNLMAVRTTLMQAIPKKEKMGYIVEKATELGVNHIMPVMTARTIVDWDEKKKAAAVTRWQKIAVEASKQCGRVDIPEIEAVEDFGGMVKSAGDYDLALIAALDAAAAPLKDALRERTLLPPSVMQGRDRNGNMKKNLPSEEVIKERPFVIS